MPRVSKNKSSEPASVKSSQDERKKLRNRLSQRAFRRRQAENLRELKHRANGTQLPDNERLATLEHENNHLRTQIAGFQSQVESIQATLSLMSKSLSDLLSQKPPSVPSPQPGAKDAPSQDPESSEGGNSITSQPTPIEVPSIAANMEFATVNETGHQPPGTDSIVSNTLFQPMMPYSAAEFNFLGNLSRTEQLDPKTPLQMQQIPRIWNFDYQMGSQSYTDALVACPGGFTNRLGWVQSNSPFSDHIHMLKRLLSSKVGTAARFVDAQSYRSIFQSVSTVWALFNSITRPDVMNWLSKTKFFHIIELTIWQILPCPYTFSRVQQQYRPTQLQVTLQGQYPCVIDWVPFPLIRDRLIQYHAANPSIDQIFCDAVSAYVVESHLSDLVIGCPPLKVYVRVTDLVISMAGDEGEDPDIVPTIPATNVQTLFTSPKHARLAFEHLKMDCGSSYYKVDPIFFEKYPELYTASDEKIAKGIPLKPEFQTTITRPVHLDNTTVGLYSNFIDFMFHVSNSLYYG
ncbi:hypothetical protein QSH57_003129 [Fusarium oxysporum f. sp. vasinfectum]|nr:hypothetical protein QSH57_003129 [Fusarium oxysporum f. sp. vasinfectum]